MMSSCGFPHGVVVLLYDKQIRNKVTIWPNMKFLTYVFCVNEKKTTQKRLHWITLQPT